jgi:hypothetical protein
MSNAQQVHSCVSKQRSNTSDMICTYCNELCEGQDQYDMIKHSIVHLKHRHATPRWFHDLRSLGRTVGSLDGKCKACDSAFLPPGKDAMRNDKEPPHDE